MCTKIGPLRILRMLKKEASEVLGRENSSAKQGVSSSRPFSFEYGPTLSRYMEQCEVQNRRFIWAMDQLPWAKSVSPPLKH